jgi:hypothetical protein
MSNLAMFGGAAMQQKVRREVGFRGLGDSSSDTIANGRAVLEAASQHMDMWANPNATPGAWYWNLKNTLKAYDAGGMTLAAAVKSVDAFANAVQSVLPAAPQTAVQRRPDLAAVIEGYYSAYFSRHSDPGGLEFFTQQLIDGISPATIQQGFISSPEYLAAHPVEVHIPPPPGPTGISTLAPPPIPISETITLPVVGVIPKKTALLVGAAIAAYFLLGK